MKIAFLTTDNREHFKDYTATRPYFGQAPEALLQGFALLPNVEVHVVSCTRVPMQSPSQIAPNISFHSLFVPKLGWMTSAYQGTVRAIRRKLREIRPAIAHGQGTEKDCAINAVCSGIRNVLTIHGNMRLIASLHKAPALSFLWLAARLEGMTIPRSDGVVCISRYTQQAVSPIARRTWVVPNAVDASFFEVESGGSGQTVPRLLCVGLVCERKNQNAYIRALDPLAEKQRFELVFLGNVAPEESYGREFLGLVQARPWCKYAGFADRIALKKQLAEAALLVLPSLEDNCPMVVLEAMAAGVPVMAAKVGGVPDQIEEGRTGEFCDPLDMESMRRTTTRLLADPQGARAMAARAKESARQRFHPRVIAQRHLEIYEEVLATPQQ